MKKICTILIAIFLFGCNNNIKNTSSLNSLNSIIESEKETSFSSSEDSLLSSETTSSENNTSSTIEQSTSKVTTSSSSFLSNSSEKEMNDENNLPIPTKEVSSWGQEEVIYDFNDSFPEEFSYVYGYKVLNNPSFYASGGWKITIPNSSARLGFQTPLFNTDLKIEVRLYIGDINNSNNKVDKDNPFITVYGFNKNGKLIRTVKIENLTNFYNYQNSKSPLNFYLNGDGLDYFELRFTAPPYKGSQCYNFAIKKIGFKTFPYPAN